ncbi:MAG: hypothetical protein OEY49_08795 [Candidatus Heimdallarchaeota archaeon]|nr:hypothetical protein [Candidatus Heimdallarchaeota archaeon]
MAINVIIADSSRWELDKLGKMIEDTGKITVIDKTTSGIELLSKVRNTRVDVIIVTTNIPDISLKKIVLQIINDYPVPILLLYTKNEKSKIEEIDKLDFGIVDSIEIGVENKSYVVSEVALTTRIHILSKLDLKKFKGRIELTKSRMSTKDKQLSRITIDARRNNHVLDRSKYNEYDTFSEDPSMNALTELYSGKGRNSKLIIIGTSTGGPKVLNEIVPQFPKNFPAVIIVQHMPKGFIEQLADRLNEISTIHVKVAEDTEMIRPGVVYLAPSGLHLKLVSPTKNQFARISLVDGPNVNYVKPAVDVTLNSAVEIFGRNIISVIMTGMGQDGKLGSEAVSKAGGKIIALSKEDSEIYGMNRAVIEAGIVNEILPKKRIVYGIIKAIESNT